MNALQRTALIENWIAIDELPSQPGLKPIRQFDGIYPTDDDEREAYFDFIHWYITMENPSFQLLKLIRYDRRDAKQDPTSRASLQLFPET